MSKKIVYTDTNGTVKIDEISEKALQIMSIDEIAIKIVPEGLTYRVTDANNISSDRTFREAWKENNSGQTIDVDMAQAKVIQQDKIRAARDSQWPDLDRRYLSVQRDNLDLTALDAERQTLKDIPNNAQVNIDVAADVTALKAAWPTELA